MFSEVVKVGPSQDITVLKHCSSSVYKTLAEIGSPIELFKRPQCGLGSCVSLKRNE